MSYWLNLSPTTEELAKIKIPIASFDERSKTVARSEARPRLGDWVRPRHVERVIDQLLHTFHEALGVQ
jgi:hypothetical protein